MNFPLRAFLRLRWRVTSICFRPEEDASSIRTTISSPAVILGIVLAEECRVFIDGMVSGWVAINFTPSSDNFPHRHTIAVVVNPCLRNCSAG